MKNNLFNRIFKKSPKVRVKPSWIEAELERSRQHENDTIRMMDRISDLKEADKIPVCFPSYYAGNYHYHDDKYKTRTKLGRYAHYYIDILEVYKRNPETTLKELFELEPTD